MPEAKNKADLMIEVWEKLDCESVGTKEMRAIEMAVRERFGSPAVDSPMVIARMLADEGAVLRHSEIMALYVERALDRPYEPAFRNILNIDGLSEAAKSLRRLENLRRKYLSDNDEEGLRLVREKGKAGRIEALNRANSRTNGEAERQRYAEVAEWITLWLQSPDMFETWIDMRLSSADFTRKFPGSVEE
ncbi:MAG: hypothetical protein IT174_01485 [Acidobacteria bacterium]|nr:hypothetical protein [Acidobacteriota bacterium]